MLYNIIFCVIIIYIHYEIINFISLIIPHRSLFELIIKNCKRLILSQSVNLLMIFVITPLLVTYVIAVESIYMGSRKQLKFLLLALYISEIKLF